MERDRTSQDTEQQAADRLAALRELVRQTLIEDKLAAETCSEVGAHSEGLDSRNMLQYAFSTRGSS